MREVEGHMDVESLESYKRYSIRCAKELCYPSEVLDEIAKAETKVQISNILANARKACKR